MTVRERWIDLYYRAATGSLRGRALLTPVGAALFWGFIALLVAASLWLDRLLSFPGLLPMPWDIVVAAPLLVLGSFLVLWSVLHFARVRGTPVPLNPPPTLVTSGPYAYARNPMLSGVFVLMAGTGVLLDSISVVFILTPIFVLLNYLELKAIEEPELERRLGDAYVAYRQRVPMFIPRPGANVRR